jgi:3-deoxy-manno-octulosonate cytidylyltransferase (CMP-KDO synthetase)
VKNVLIIIPARMASTRLPRKMLALIHGIPTIVHVAKRAMAQNIASVVVACDDDEVAEVLKNHDIPSVLTRPEHLTGTDRIAEALMILESGRSVSNVDYVINLQGDLPYFSADLNLLLDPFQSGNWDMSTFVHPFQGPYQKESPHAVKAILNAEQPYGQCLDFSRHPFETDVYHIGVYAFRKESLIRFYNLPQDIREKEESLEQLRALQAGFRIAGVRLKNENFISIDTQDDLDYASSFPSLFS